LYSMKNSSMIRRRLYHDTLRFLGVCPSFKPKLRFADACTRARYRAFGKMLGHLPNSTRRVLRRSLPKGVPRRRLENIRQANVGISDGPNMDSVLRKQLLADVIGGSRSAGRIDRPRSARMAE